MNEYLDYYKKFNIIPVVKLQKKNFNSIKLQRFGFYFNLGISPSDLKNKEVLEVCPGSGYNAYYLLKYAKIKNLTLVDNNPESTKSLKKNFSKLNNVKIINKNLKSFKTNLLFDYVIIENALPGFDNPKIIFNSLLKMLKPSGCIIFTLTDSLSMLSEKLRYLHSQLILRTAKVRGNNFLLKTNLLSAEFESHLNQLGKKKRNTDLWVQDNMLHLHWIRKKKYFSFLEMYKILNKEKYLIKGTSPDFTSQNYDWYKNFNIKKYNNNFKIDYLKNRLNLVHMFEIFKFSNTNLKIKNLILKINSLVVENINDLNHKKKLLEIIRNLLLLSKLLKENKNKNRVSIALIEFVNLLRSYLTKTKKPPYLNYKKFWGNATNQIAIVKIN
jgi:ubiquinone/menaquinone biosynthesis C-methylase UbiE